MNRWYWALAAMLLPITGIAGSYHLQKGQGRAVCEAFLRNLNTFPPNTPMSCKRRINKKYTHVFTRPNWKSLDPWKHIDQLWKFSVYSTSVWGEDLGIPEMTKREWLEWYKKFIKKRGYTVVLKEGHFDLDNDGTIDNVRAYGYKLEYCKSEPRKPKFGNGYFLFVKNEDDKQFLYAAPRNGFPRAYDVFRFDNNIYLNQWIMGSRLSSNGKDNSNESGGQYDSYVYIYRIYSDDIAHGSFAHITSLCQYRVILPFSDNREETRSKY